MVINRKLITCINNLFLDGKSSKLGTSPIYYVGMAHKPYDVVIDGESSQTVVLNSSDNISRTVLNNISCVDLKISINGSQELLTLKNQIILGRNINMIEIINDNKGSGLVEVSHVGVLE